MTSDRRDKALETWISRPQPPRSAVAGDDCPDQETLAVWLEGGLSDDALERVITHTATCERCEAIVATLVRTESVQPTADRHTLPAVPSWRRALAWGVPMAAAAVVALAVWVRTPQPNPASPSIGALTAESDMTTASGSTSATAGAAAASVPSAELRSAPAPAPSPGPSARSNTGELADAGRVNTGALERSADRQKASGADSPSRIGAVSGAATNSPGIASAERQPGSAESTSRVARLDAGVPAAGAPPRVAASEAPPAAQQPPPPQSSTSQAQASPKRAAEPTAAAAQAGRDSFDSNAVPSPVTSPAGANRSNSAARWTVLASPSNTPVCRYRSRTIEHSTDAGATWMTIAPESPAALLTGVAVSDTVCWLAGERGTVLLVTRGQPAAIPIPAALDLTGIRARDALVASVTSATGRVFTTSDSGRTWRPQ